MKKCPVIKALIWTCFLLQCQAPSARKAYEFANGLWFDGEKFTSKKFYAIDGILTEKAPARVDSVIDLTGQYVIPPFAEAHNHNVEGANVEETIQMYLEAGIFYVKNPNSLPRTTAPVLEKVNITTSLDVVFANGGLTATGGHPLGLARRNIARGIWTAADAEEAFYYAIDDMDDLNQKWEMILAGKPDFIKTYLLYSEEYEKRKDDTTYFAWKGLDPALLPEIVNRAHKSGLRVSTHIESATDFHNAVVAGVDEINHLAGFRPDDKILATGNFSAYEISEEDAKLATQKDIVVVTTLGALIESLAQIDRNGPLGPLVKGVNSLTVRNLELLKKYGVRIAIGSDRYESTSVKEAMNLHRLGVFSNLELLKMWCEITPATIFPNRKIGHLKEGYEASFLALNGEPIEDFENVTKIEMRVKRGNIL